MVALAWERCLQELLRLRAAGEGRSFFGVDRAFWSIGQLEVSIYIAIYVYIYIYSIYKCLYFCYIGCLHLEMWVFRGPKRVVLLWH